MIYIAVVILMFANMVMAVHHANLIKNEKNILHGWWALSYFLFAALLSWLNHSWLLFIDSLFIRKVFFDLSLNIARKKPLFYVSSSTTSIIDKWHNKIFGKRSEIYMGIYTLVIIILTILL